MCYKVVVRRDGQEDVAIQVDAKELTIEQHYEGTGVCVDVLYSEGKLALYDPEGYKAIKYAWPTVDELVLLKRVEADDTNDAWEEVFAGVVTKVVDGNGEVGIAALMADEEPPNPLTVVVQEDTDDTTRMSVLVTSDNDGQGTVTVDYGNGAPTVTNPGDGTSASQYQYPTAGTYTLTVTSDSDPERTATSVVEVPYTMPSGS